MILSGEKAGVVYSCAFKLMVKLEEDQFAPNTDLIFDLELVSFD